MASGLNNIQYTTEDDMDQKEAADVVAPLPAVGSLRPSFYQLTSHLSDPSAVSQVQGDQEIIEDFMTVGEGISVAHELRDEVSALADPLSMLSHISSRLSVATTTTILPTQGGYGGQLSQLTHLISKHTALYYATILSTECYYQSIRLGIVHRFLLLELSRPGRKTIWLRLDRRRSTVVGTFQFLRSGGSTRANDTIQLSASKEALLTKKAHCENRQVFVSPPALSRLNELLVVIINQLSTYELWPNNCWFFASILQKHLSIIGRGEFTFGRIRSENLDPATRWSIDTEVERRRTETTRCLDLMVSSARTRKYKVTDAPPFAPWEIEMFIRHVFRDITLQDASLVDQLVTAVGGSFQDASTACSIVCCVPDNAADIRLRMVLTSRNASPFILERLLKQTMVALDSELRAVVHNHSDFPGTNNTNTSWSTIGELHCLIALVCLDAVDKTLRFNVCGIHTSYLPSKDEEVQEHIQQAKVEGRLTSTLIYACLGWAYHAAFLPLDERLIQAVTRLFGRPALCWLEIISLTGQDPATVLPHLRKLRGQNRRLDSRINDFIAFIDIFSKPVAQSVPHIYLSAVLFSPPNSLVRQTLPETTQLRLISHPTRTWDTLRSDFTVPGNDTSDNDDLDDDTPDLKVLGFVFSLDVSRITYVCSDGVLRAWGLHSGDVGAKMLKGFEVGWDSKVAFSADGTRLVGCRRDSSLQVWDTYSGSSIGLLKGHKNMIASVAFSPDDTIIASASEDGEIRLWDAFSLRAIVRPTMGHIDQTYSISFSLDGTRLVSGGYGKAGRDVRSVRIWDVSTGLQVLQIEHDTEGFANEGQSVVCSPDGKQIASGSADGTFIVWDAGTGNLRFEALKPDWSDGILSFAYSPDGRYLASGGRKGNIHIWDSQTGEHVNHLKLGPDRISEINFSRDGRRLACRLGMEIWVWELQDNGYGLKDYTGLRYLDLWERTSIREKENSGKLPFPIDLKVDKDGWLRGTEGQLIVWVPPGLRANVQSQARLVINPSKPAPTVIDFGDFNGERWAEIFRKGL